MISFKSIEQYHAALRRGDTTCVEAVKDCLSAIAAHQHLNCYLEVFEQEALERAALLDQQHDRPGKLHGVIIGIKDNICYQHHRSSAASRILEGFVSIFSATAVQRLLHEGAIIIGRQNCDEFGMGSTNENSAYGAVLNPQDESRVPGGSSGGSAAAVKAGLCMAALGSDTGGSVRLPADFCGVVGFKPAYGAVSRHGLIAYASSFDQIGILANNVADASVIYEVIAGPDEWDSTSRSYEQEKEADGPKRIAYFPEWIDHPSVDPEIKNAFQEKLSMLREAGHVVEPVHFRYTDYIVPAYYVLTTAEASSNLARYDGLRFGPINQPHAKNFGEQYTATRSSLFGPEVKRRIMLGSFVLSAGYYDAYYTKAQQVRRILFDDAMQMLDNYDFILAPNSPTIAYKAQSLRNNPIQMYMGDIFTVFANLTALPAISLPVFKHSSNISFGIQLLSSPHNVVNLLRFTQQLIPKQ